MLALATVIILGWLSACTIGTWAYFAGKPESNLSLPKFVSRR
ncbi:MAG: endonuclease [Gloeocapsa sp. UFS-A4-WI-NPMV-4B04]|jgi:hypothetical protein|nr:endonuclease [Gloeocapsa sp. UFS-A4-WI-NPMV-4B04]